MSDTPRFGDIQPTGYVCVREVGRNFGDRLCGEPGLWHIRWDAEGNHAPACNLHAAEAIEKWSPQDWHELTADCMAPECVWVFGERQGEGFCSTGEVHPDLAALSVNALEAVEP